MKKIIINNKYIIALLMLFSIVACDDRELVTVEGQSSPIVADLSTTNLFLDKNFPNNPALTVNWEVATYSVPVSINYKIEAATDEKFENSVVLGNTKNSERTATFTASQVNAATGSLGLVADVSAKMYIKVTSYLGSGILSATSNVTSLNVTPYKLVYPDFYLVGAASYVDWTASNAQLLYKHDNVSEIYTYLESGKDFRFLGQQDWNPTNYSIDAAGIKDNYKYFKQTSGNIVKSSGDENMTFNGTSGIYKVSIDATSGTQKLTAEASTIPAFDIPQVYLVGNVAGVNWSAENAVAMTKTGAGVFEYTTTLPADAEFKFLGQKSFGDLDWGNITNAGNLGFLGPKGDNGNVKFVGDGGSYKITINIKAGTYTIAK